MVRLSVKRVIKVVGSFILATLSLLVIGEIYFITLNRSTLTDMKWAGFTAENADFKTYAPDSQWESESDDGTLINIKTDKLGLRNENKVYKQKKKILVLGDSYITAFNTPFEKTFTRCLDRLAGKYSVINGGVAGNSNYKSYKLLKYYFKKIKPDVVLFTVYMGNDLVDHYTERAHIPEQPQKVTGGSGVAEASPENNGEAIFSKSFSGRVRDVLKKSNFILKMYSKTVGEVKGSLNKDVSYFEFLSHQYLNTPPGYVKETLRKTESVFSLIKKFSVENNVPVVVVGIPSKAAVYKEVRLFAGFELEANTRELVLEVIRAKGGYSFDKPGEYYERICNSMGLPFYSLTDSFRENKNRPLYCAYDTHWCEDGQELAAELVFQKLVSLNMVK